LAIVITLTRLDKRVIVLNADLIKMIEATPDTIITLINGDTMVVREDVEEVVRRAIDYARQVRSFQVV
jgi:flagellar protein FlbD